MENDFSSLPFLWKYVLDGFQLHRRKLLDLTHSFRKNLGNAGMSDGISVGNINYPGISSEYYIRTPNQIELFTNYSSNMPQHNG